MLNALRSTPWLVVVGACTGSVPVENGSDSADAFQDDWDQVVESTGAFDADWAERWAEAAEAIGPGALLIRDLKAGNPMELAWAQQSSVACFPGTQNASYEGHHLLFVMQKPAHTAVEIRVEPEAGVDISIYSLQQGTESYILPPDTQQAVSCEASLSESAGVTEKLELVASNNPYNLVIGVAGTAEQNSGRLLLELVSPQ